MDNNDLAENQRRQTRFYRQLLVLTPMVVLWMYSISDAFVLSGPGDAAARFVAETRIGQDHGIPICQLTGGGDVYLNASMWKWEPQLVLRKGESYTLHLSAQDVPHGFALDAFGLQALVDPGQEQVLQLTPDQSGDFVIRCDEYCGPGHEIMTGKLRVVD